MARAPKADANARILARQLERWYDLIPHPVQLQLVAAIDNGARFCVVPAGRRSGKTERAKRFLVKRAMENDGEMLFAAAPTYNQAKKIWWQDLKDLALSCLHARAPSETELTIYFPNGSTISVIGLDKPQRFEGVPWSGGVIDEIADVKAESIDLNIMPALDTVNPTRPDYRAWCWFIGVPEGLNHYYKMAEYARAGEDPAWRLFTWHSADILPEDVIIAAKKKLSKRQFEQEYCAGFVTTQGRIYDDYGDENRTLATIGDTEALHWMHDQNFTPLSSAIAVLRNGIPYLLDEIVLESAVSRQSALEFTERFANHRNKLVYIYGDPAGRAGEKHGHKSDYSEIEDVLRTAGWRFERRVKAKHPAIKDRQNAVRALICNAMLERRLFVNSQRAPWCHEGLATVQLQPGSTFQEDQRNQYQHITTAIGYFVDYLWPVGTIPATSSAVVRNY